MKKLKLFVENFLVYGLGSIISKLVPLMMVPILTRILPNSTYLGINDISSTIISFASALSILGMFDAMYRSFFDKDDIEYKKTVCSTTLIFTFFSSITIFLLLILFKNQISKICFGDVHYAYLLYITAIASLLTSTNGIVSAPTRMQNQRKIFLITNTLTPILAYGIAIPLILKGYYIIALPLSSAISGLVIEVIFIVLNRKWFSFKKFDFKILKQLLVFALPLVPNFLIYWIFNSSDKLMISNILDIGATGIYSIASKIGHISQLIYTAFAGGWQYFAFSTMKEDNQVEQNSLIFEYLAMISFIATISLCTFSKLIFELLFVGEYINAYIIAPYLFLAPLLQMLFQVSANQFLVIKKTWPNSVILLSGAVLNVVLNLVLIPKMGIEGAAIATLIGYMISVIITIIVLKFMKLMVISKRFIINLILFINYFIFWRILFQNSLLITLFIDILFLIIASISYKAEITTIISMFTEKLKSKNNKKVVEE